MALGISEQELTAALEEAQAMTPREAALAKRDRPILRDEHLVDFVTEVVKESFEFSKDRRILDNALWEAHETRMDEMNDKEEWQSRIILNKPFTTAYQANSILRRGLIEKPDYFDLTPINPDDPQEQMIVDFWKKNLKFTTNRPESRLQAEFADASHMAFAIGQSMLIKALWKQNEYEHWGLKYKRFEPWKEYSDPDRAPRSPWSGLCAVHEEWVDLHEIQTLADQGFYVNVEQIDPDGGAPSDAASRFRREIEEQRDEDRRKRGESMMRNRFRKPVLLRECWGTILDESGRIALKNHSFTQANNVIIRGSIEQDGPIESPFPMPMRWPWVSYSPLPHPIRFHGYGLYEGVLAIWKLQSQLMNLYLDNETYRIMNMFELDPDVLKDPNDTECFPGKRWLRRAGADPNSPAVKPVLKAGSNLQDVQFIWAIATNLWENGSFVTEFTKGETGNKNDQVTATQYMQETAKALGVFDTIGKDAEEGCVQVIKMTQLVLQTFQYEFPDPALVGQLQANPIFQQLAQGMFPDDRQKLLHLPSDIQVHGISRAFEKAGILTQLNAAIQVGTMAPYAMYVKHYKLIQRYFESLNQPDLVLTEDELQVMQRQMMLEEAKSGALAAAGIEEEPAPQGQIGQGHGGSKGKPSAGQAQPRPDRPQIMSPAGRA